MNKKILLNDAIETGKKVLKENNIQNADWESIELIKYVENLDTSKLLLTKFTEYMSDENYQRYIRLIKRRALNEPLQHIIGYTSFYGRNYIVNENVLTPRPETEELVENVIELIEKIKYHNKIENKNDDKNIKVLDLCTGSGCIGITIKKEVPEVIVTIADISTKALEVAKKNAIENEADVTIIKSDMFTDIKDEFDIIVSNPPYVTLEEMNGLDIEVKEYDPRIALTDEGDGLKFYRIIASSAKTYLKKNGYVALEIGCNQGKDVKEILEQTKMFENALVKKDLSQRDRIVIAKYK